MENVAVVRCAPGPVNPALYFDNQGQFDHRFRKLHVVSQKTQLTFADVKGMHVHNHTVTRSKRFLPPWAFSDHQFRMVILQRGWNYVHGGFLMPPDTTFEEVKSLVDAKFENIVSREWAERGSKQWHAHQEHIFAVRKAGGYLELITSVLYKSLRQGHDSPTVAQVVGMRPPIVRQMVCRANAVARMLGFESFAPHWSSKRHERKFRKVRVPREKLPRKVRVPREKAPAPVKVHKRRGPKPGIQFTQEHREKIGLANKGKVRSPEVRARISASVKRTLAQRQNTLQVNA